MFNWFKKKIAWCIECQDAKVEKAGCKTSDGYFCSTRCYVKYHGRLMPPAPSCPEVPEGLDISGLASSLGPLPRCSTHGVIGIICNYCWHH